MKKIYNDIPKVSSALTSVDLFQEPRPLIIGERLNSQGSKKAKKMVLEDDFDGLIDIARNQVQDGAHCIDVCVATTERSDELEFMVKLVKRLSLEIEAPLVIDSTDSKVISAALRQIPGIPIINSINLEGDGSRFTDIAPLMKKYGSPAVSMCIGPNGMAKTSNEKLSVANLLYDKSISYGLKPWQLIFDVLTFTLATGEKEYVNSAIDTLKGIKLVKENHPKSLTTLGLSNISFGLPSNARKYLNSVFLYYAIKNGLDTVIINPKDIIPYPQINSSEKKICEDLIFNNSDTALAELIAHFTSTNGISKSSSNTRSQIQNNLEIDNSWPASQKCYFRIVNRLKEGIEDDVVLAISEKMKDSGQKISIKGKDGDKVTENLDKGSSIILLGNKEYLHKSAVDTLNKVLLPAMKEVGDKFGSGELILPFVLKSAECMKAAVSELEKYLIKQEGVSKGKLVLCTVYGDVHDIGKNLVKTIFSNNGYEVFDLGKQVPIPIIVNKIKEVKADAVGLSALLVSTSKQMQLFADYLRENKIDIPVLCGGAAINSDYINRIAKGDDNIYKAGYFYCKTAFDGLKIMNNLMNPNREHYINEWRDRMQKWSERKYDNKIDIKDLEKITSDVKPVTVKPIPPKINSSFRLYNKDIDLLKIWELLNKKSLFVLSWGLRGKNSTKFKDEYENILNDWKSRIIEENLFEPQAVYGYFKCRKVENNKLVVYYYDEELDKNSELIFEFPRSSVGKHLCLADYFDSENDDIVAFQSVTMGNKVADVIEKWNQENKYSDAYYLHGLGVESTEALADWLNLKIRKELGLEKGCLRYSWGYPSCPDISQHFLVWKLLNPNLSGMSLTESGQIIPEYSTAAIIVHNPVAEYFVT